MPPKGWRIQPMSLVDRAHEELSRRIADGVLAPGERLVIDRLAVEFDTSLIPVREALARLRAEGLVTSEPNRGYRVSPAPTPRQIEQMFELRLYLECGALELGVARMTDHVLAILRSLNDQIASGRYGKTFDGYRRFVECNRAFHEQIVALADNPFLTKAYRQLGFHEQTLRLNAGRGVPDLQSNVAEHAAVIAALATGDGDTARDALGRHIRGGYQRLMQTGSGRAG